VDPFDYNFAHSLATFAACSKSGEVIETRDALVTHHRAPVAEFNQCYLKTPDYKLERTLDRIVAHQRRIGVPLRLHLASEHAEAAAMLAERGAVQAGEVPALTLDVSRSLPPAPADLRVTTVRDASALEAFGRMAFSTFSYPPELAAVTFTDDLRTFPHAELLLGSVDGTPVCCSMVLVTGNIAGIYWVGVAEPHRRRGLGAAITAAAVHAGVRRGCDVASLQASTLGEPVYRRMGFEPIRSYLRLDLPPPR
jgi:GNAT superfamily N-acetyltransferase